MLFVNGPDRAKSEREKEFFRLKQKEALNKLRKEMAVADAAETVSFEVLGAPPELNEMDSK